jgi:hypothetical protein
MRGIKTRFADSRQLIYVFSKKTERNTKSVNAVVRSEKFRSYNNRTPTVQSNVTYFNDSDIAY